MKKLIILVLGFIILASCAPDRFYINQDTDFPVLALKLSHIDSVEQVNANEIILNSGGIVSLKSYFNTQNSGDFTVQILSGQGVSFLFRTVSDKYEGKPNLRFDFTKNGSFVFENDKQLTKVDSVKAKANALSRVIIRNDGINYSVTVDCDTVIKARTKLPATEYIIVKSLNNSKINISGIQFDEEYGWNKLKTN